ncbi:hypothetical protein [Evansella halocellulosilytica]|uniref:hypothetical protein n=1 Tax=Evansella halocellulosilytica TaxID=2011013 RepID=UPI000BB88DE0|nr:hypothetical protein [Evansella halocellulosilytica]
MHDGLKLAGKINATLRDKEGNVKQQFEEENLIVNGGKDGLAEQLLNSPAVSVPSHIGIGTDGTAPVLSDTDLLEQEGSRQSVSKQRNLNEVEFSAVFGPNEPVSESIEIREAGLFNAATGGSMWARITFGVVTKEPEDTFDITWTWVISNAQ